MFVYFPMRKAIPKFFTEIALAKCDILWENLAVRKDLPHTDRIY